MAIGNVNNNTSAQLQAYAQDKASAALLQPQKATAATKSVVSSSDSVQISEQAKALLAQDALVSTQGNGGGVEPPKDPPVPPKEKEL
jgi:hypothetical protein